MSNLDNPAARLAEFCARQAGVVVLLALLATALCTHYVVSHIRIDTDIVHLMATDLPWRQREQGFDRAFPQSKDLIVVVLDAATQENADMAADDLVARLRQHPDLILAARRPDGGAFFARNGLLFLSTGEVQKLIDSLIAAQGFLGPLAADPSLRGVFDTLSLALRGVREGTTKLDKLAKPFAALADAFEAIADGHPQSFSWRRLVNDDTPTATDLRRIILVQPKLDFEALQPGARASALIRAQAKALSTPTRVRLTGQVALADEEFIVLADGMALNFTGTFVALLVILWLALRSGRLILAVFANLFVGLALTAAAGIALVASLNVISVAFAALFIGLGVDFGIQYGVRYRHERYAGGTAVEALVRASGGIVQPLALAAAAIAAGFFSFLPTSYRGVSELGLIAGLGMMIAFTTSLTFLPALITLLRPNGERADPGLLTLAAADAFFGRHRRGVLVVTVLVALAGLPFALKLQFDSNPLNLRSAKVESVSTLLEVARDPATNPNVVEVLSPSADAATALAARLTQLPEVEKVITLSSFVPADQNAKLPIIEDAAMLLGPTLDPLDVAPKPAPADIRAALDKLVVNLRAVEKGGRGAVERDAGRLARGLEKLAANGESGIATARTVIVTPLRVLLAQINAALQAGPVTLNNLPQDTIRDWRTPDGRTHIDIVPKGDPTDSKALARFNQAVLRVAPQASGGAISIAAAGDTVTRAFVEAGIWAFLSISLILLIALRRIYDVAWSVLPLLVSGLLTFEAASAFGLHLNFANIIALPLMFGVGVAFHVYYVIAWRRGVADVLQTSLTRAILFSALATGTAFGSLWLSGHPGTSSMGKLLALSLVFTLVTAFIIVPACLGPPRARISDSASEGSGPV